MKGSTIMLMSCYVGAAILLLLQFCGLTEVSRRTRQEATEPEAPPVLKSLDSASKSINNVSSAARNVKLLSTAIVLVRVVLASAEMSTLQKMRKPRLLPQWTLHHLL